MNEDEVRDYLVQNPGFLQDNPDLLSLLSVPHASGSAVSLVERQVSVLRERNVDLRHRLRDLDDTARDNDQLFAQLRVLVLALLSASDVSELRTALFAVLRDEFGVEYASLLLFDDSFPSEEGSAEREQTLERLRPLLARANAGCGALRAEEFATLFAGSRLEGSAAAALIPGEDGNLGLLAVGSANSGYYDSNMDTLFLEFAAEVLGRLLSRFKHPV